MIELAELTRRLGQVVRAEAIPVWLNVIALDDEKPIELIGRGDYKGVSRLIAAIEYPGVS